MKSDMLEGKQGGWESDRGLTQKSEIFFFFFSEGDFYMPVSCD